MLWTLLLPTPAEAFTTRVHLALANEVREALLASDDGRTVALRGVDAAVRWSEADARAVRDWPEAFQAGAIGPDNFVFPGMTDLTHAVWLRPYDQCEDLYQLARTDEERAYAMGCFLHGASDAVAHHLVNWLTGETFTLNPISSHREEDYANVARHVVAEAMIQEAWLAADPDVFSAEAMAHAIPAGFVLRAVVHPDSPAWRRMVTHALPAWEVSDAALPLSDRVASLPIAAAEHVALLPLYLDAARADLDGWIPSLRADLAAMQDPGTPDGARLGVTPGPDGVLGTEDDDTACLIGCLSLYAEYFSLISLLEPRPDRGGTSAADELVAGLHQDLDGLLPAYVETVAATSAALNAPIAPGEDGFDLDDLEAGALTAPLEAWGADLIDLDWRLIADTLLPDWALALEGLLGGLGLPMDLAGLLQGWLGPRLEALRDGAIGAVSAGIDARIGALTEEIAVSEAAIRAEYEARLAEATPPGHASFLEALPDSGLLLHSFDAVAVTLADHRVFLPTGDAWAGVGPASFDASHTLTWSQAGACEDLAAVVTPLGPGLDGLLSLWIDGARRPASAGEEAPVECHDGALDEFGEAPDAVSCALTGLDDLRATGMGSLSRAFPPSTVDLEPACLGLVIDGLPAPADPTDPAPTADDHGCGCAPGRAGAVGAVLPLLAIAALRRRPLGSALR